VDAAANCRFSGGGAFTKQRRCDWAHNHDGLFAFLCHFWAAESDRATIPAVSSSGLTDVGTRSYDGPRLEVPPWWTRPNSQQAIWFVLASNWTRPTSRQVVKCVLASNWTGSRPCHFGLKHHAGPQAAPGWPHRPPSRWVVASTGRHQAGTWVRPLAQCYAQFLQLSPSCFCKLQNFLCKILIIGVFAV
jgi:hypothetical protein